MAATRTATRGTAQPQSRPGPGPAPGSTHNQLLNLQRDAGNRAVTDLLHGAGPAAPLHVVQHDKRRPETAGDDDKTARAESRRRDKRKTQRRKKARASAGKQGNGTGREDASREEAERELRALEDSYRQPGAQSRSRKRKTGDLKRYERLLERAGGTRLEKNRRKGAFDELQRTPTKSYGKPQSKHGAGGEQLPDQDLRTGRDAYAQPDYSIIRRRRDGGYDKLHVNLKSDKIDTQTPARARVTARAYVRQAIRNSQHLRDGDTIVIDFARAPSKAVQEAMKEEFFKAGSPVGEVRFGTATHRRADYKPPAPATGGKPGGKKKPRKPPAKKKSGAKLPTARPASKKRTAAAPASAPVAVRAKLPKAGTGGKLPKATARYKAGSAKATAPAKIPVAPPRISTGGAGSSRSARVPRSGLGGSGATAAAGLGAIFDAFVMPIILGHVQEQFAEGNAKEARELIANAIDGHRAKFEALVEKHLPEVQAAQAEGREVSLHVVVDTNWVDTNIGRLLTKASVARFELVYEDGPPPKRYSRHQPGWIFGEVARFATDVTLSHDEFDIPLEGTDPVAAGERLSRKVIDARLRYPKGSPPVKFESLIVQALENNTPLDALRHYAEYHSKGKFGDAAGFPRAPSYWQEMVDLIDGSLDVLIAKVKAQRMSLEFLRGIALYRQGQADKAGDAETATYWAEMVRLIDGK